MALWIYEKIYLNKPDPGSEEIAHGSCQKNYLKKFCKFKSVKFVFFCSKIWKNFPTSIIRLVLFLMSTLGQI